MVTSKVDLWNLAIAAIGGSKFLTDPDEQGIQADRCRLFYPVARDRVLAAAPWSEARTYAQLALTKARDTSLAWGLGDPAPGFAYAHRLPSDMIRPNNLATYNTFTLGNIAGLPQLMSNEETPILIYTARIDNPAVWGPGLVDAISLTLASMLVMPNEGKTDRAQLAINLANEAILTARTHAANAEPQQFETIPDFLAARGISGPLNPNRYIYPVGPLISLSMLSV